MKLSGLSKKSSLSYMTAVCFPLQCPTLKRRTIEANIQSFHHLERFIVLYELLSTYISAHL